MSRLILIIIELRHEIDKVNETSTIYHLIHKLALAGSHPILNYKNIPLVLESLPNQPHTKTPFKTSPNPQPSNLNMTAPTTILFIPGYWEGPKPFQNLSSLLQASGLATETATLPSTGTTSPSNPGMHDDIAAIRKVVSKLVEEEQRDVVMVLHSAGGFLGANATEGLDVPARKAKGLVGGVRKMVFLAGGVLPVGVKHQPLPFFKIEVSVLTLRLPVPPFASFLTKGGALFCKEPERLLFNDLGDEDKEEWLTALAPQPARDWDDVITYAGWKDVPCVYLVCGRDQVIPPAMQVQWAESIGARVERCEAGHMPMLSVPERVVEVIMGAVEGV